jgi:hypothetical protein
MRTLRRQRAQAPGYLRRRREGGAAADATLEPDPGPGPEVVFDRVTGPYAHRRIAAVAPGLGAYDEET